MAFALGRKNQKVKVDTTEQSVCSSQKGVVQSVQSDPGIFSFGFRKARTSTYMYVCIRVSLLYYDSTCTRQKYITLTVKFNFPD